MSTNDRECNIRAWHVHYNQRVREQVWTVRIKYHVTFSTVSKVTRFNQYNKKSTVQEDMYTKKYSKIVSVTKNSHLMK